jgi:hypothetical protein
MSSLSPVVLRSVPFHDDTLEAIQVAPDKVYVSLRRCCECLGIDFASQYRRLTDKARSPWACIVVMTIQDVSGRQQESCLIDLDTLPMWLATIDVSRVTEGVRPKLVQYQKECVQVLRDHFFGKPPEDPVLVSLQAAVQLRHAQLALEKKVEVVNRVATDAKETAEAALKTAEGNFGYFAVLAYAKLIGKELDYAPASVHGKRLTAICNQKGLEVRRIKDPRFGTVNLYPESVLKGYFYPANSHPGE